MNARIDRLAGECNALHRERFKTRETLIKAGTNFSIKCGELQKLKGEIKALRKTLTYIRNTSDDWHVCEKAADALRRGHEKEAP